MPKVITVANMKGGVGKTTLSVNLAFELFYRQNKVLVIDNDPQFNATTSFVRPEQYVEDYIKNTKFVTTASIYEKRMRGSKAPNDAPLPVNRCWMFKNTNWSLDLVGSTLDLNDTLKNPNGKVNFLKNFISKRCQDYDYVIIDCPPTPGILTEAALEASNYAIVPVTPDYFASIGLPQFIRSVEEFKEDQADANNVQILGVVFSRVPRLLDALSRQAIEEVRTIDPGKCKPFENHLPEFKVFARSLYQARPLGMLSGKGQRGKNEAMQSMRQLTDEIIIRIEALEKI